MHLSLAAPVAAQPQIDERSAGRVHDDAFSVCGHAIPDRERVSAACLTGQISAASPAPCRTVMPRYSKPAAQRQRGAKTSVDVSLIDLPRSTIDETGELLHV